jgi:hypothetical protein
MIGMSEPCCFVCNLLLKHIRQTNGKKIYVSGCIERIDGKWCVPRISDECMAYVESEVDKRFSETLKSIIARIKKEV